MSLTAAVRRWLSDDPDVTYECRNCGTTLESTERTCPVCGSIEIAEYDAAEYDAAGSDSA
ncbi:zinc-ribbon domain-containing protein [Halosolutus halophilus]|uniref:zinc-ribbon domain-containing protein n=1 Tax=Halosolutus halophilus TaxID=1552990 RepID=UPI00223512E2|nr:zinc-ribbon domain-containing protein [Halosolutus halophilus]